VLTKSRVDDVLSVIAFVDFLTWVDCRQIAKISTVAVASRIVITDVRPCDMVVARLTWRLLDFLVCVATCGLLGMLVSVATPIVLVVVAVVIPSRVGSSS
jgi:hypothetical protein